MKQTKPTTDAARDAGHESQGWYLFQASGGPPQIRELGNDARVATLADYNALENARLICGAHELLATLRLLVKQYEKADEDGDLEHLNRTQDWKVARAAIAKATLPTPAAILGLA